MEKREPDCAEETQAHKPLSGPQRKCEPLEIREHYPGTKSSTPVSVISLGLWAATWKLA